MSPSNNRQFATVVIMAALAVAALGRASSASAAGDPGDGKEPVLIDSRKAAKLVVRPVTPDYPPVARMNYIQGPVRMQVTVSDQGEVRDARVVEGHPLLAASALKAVKRWLFRPFRRGGDASGFQALVDVNFSLRVRKVGALPPKPEEYLERQVRPPEVVEPPRAPAGAPIVRMRVLVGEDGGMLDAKPMAGAARYFQLAREHVEGWRFRPARWGAVAVPWYLEVDVPVLTGERAGAADTGGQ